MQGLLAQDYPSMEILLVNAGSTDGTARLLDRVAAHGDARVLHLEGRNLADARNAAVEAARGRYVTFVDGEDLVAPWYVSALVGAAGTSGDRMVVCAARVVSEVSLAELPAWEEPAPAQPIARWQVARNLMLGTFLPVASCRLAPRELFLRSPFPSGRLYEGLWTCSDYVRDIRSWAYVPTPGYAVVLRDDSPSRGRFTTTQQIDEFHEACLWTGGAILALYPDMEAEVAAFERTMAGLVDDLSGPGRLRDALLHASPLVLEAFRRVSLRWRDGMLRHTRGIL